MKPLLLPIAAISMVFVMLVPVPAFLLDILLVVSILASVVVFLTAIQVSKGTDFSVFPSLLLLLTLFRLSLNIASSRRILLHGNEGTSAAGHVIQSFGQFVAGGNYVVGFVLFLLLVAIQFLVITYGAVRTAEVTARFTLDALPGKQLAIDAEMNAGLIDQQGARRRRDEIAREAEFYGAMDGTAKFNQRDALATILITAINIVAGIIIGTLQHGLDFYTAAKTYTVLTVGDGLVTLIPSLLVSIAGGVILTNTSTSGGLDLALRSQLLRRASTLWIAAAVLASLALLPGMPKMTLVLMAAVSGLVASKLPAERPALEDVSPGREEARVENQPTDEGEDPGRLLRVDELTLEIGLRLIPLVSAQQSAPMLKGIHALRRQLALELGFIVPPIAIRDNLHLKAREYCLQLRGIEVGRGRTEAGCLLALNADALARAIPEMEMKQPGFAPLSRWIQPDEEEQVLAVGCTLLDEATAIQTHLSEIIRAHAHELLGRQETKRLLDSIYDTQPTLVEELIPSLMSLGEVQRVLQQLLREQVSIRSVAPILEALVEASHQSKQLVHLVEHVRQSLGRSLVHPLLDSEGRLRVLLLEQHLEEELIATFDPQRTLLPADGERRTGGHGEYLRNLLESVKRLTGEASAMALPVLLCPSPTRYHVRRWLEPFVPKLAVLAPAEIPPEVQVRSVGTVSS